MRARVLVASIAVHGVLGALLLALALRSSSPPSLPNVSTSIEVISAPVVEPTPAATQAVDATPTTGAATSTRARTAKSRGGGPRFVDPRGDISIESGAGGAGEGEGTGDGPSGGDGLGGGGFGGSAAGAVPRVDVPPPPAAAKVSKARPAILIYPKKHGTDDDTAVFVAQVTIDDEGYVVGAHVLRGEGGPRGQQASDLIWRFRYEPALDDDGRPVRSTIEQPFLVGR